MATIVFLIIAALIVWFSLSVIRTKKQTQKGRSKQEIFKYPGAGINAPLDACNAVKALEGKRFLAQEAPSLPLQECDAEECHCKYEHFKDRRDIIDKDRRNEHGSAQNIFKDSSSNDRRERKDRRSAD